MSKPLPGLNQVQVDFSETDFPVLVSAESSPVVTSLSVLSDWLQDDNRTTSALVNAFHRLDYDLSVEAQVHLSLTSPR